jgi:putative membrane protein
MSRFLLHLVLNVVGLFLAIQFVPGIKLDSSSWWLALVIIGLVFGAVNAVVRPILLGLSCLLNLLTLGLFTFVINAAMLLLTAYIGNSLGDRLGFRFVIDGWVAALLGSIVISIFSWIIAFFVRENKRR